MLPELDTGRLKVRLARPGMEAAMARFLADNYPGHLDRWSPPPVEGYFTSIFWRERFAIAVEEYKSDRAVRFVLQARHCEASAGSNTRVAPAGSNASGVEEPILGTCNYTHIVRGAFHACHLGYQIGRDHEGKGLMAEALRATNDFMFRRMRMHRLMANFRPENARSRALLERLGFVEEGVAKDYLYIDGAWRDHVLTSLIHPNYDDAWMLAPR